MCECNTCLASGLCFKRVLELKSLLDQMGDALWQIVLKDSIKGVYNEHGSSRSQLVGYGPCGTIANAALYPYREWQAKERSR